MSSSSSSSLSQTRRKTVGVPSRCWCGSKLTTFGAQTKENLYRRFYRCEIGVKRQSERHLFKWIEEAIIDEIKIVDSKHRQLEADVQSLAATTTQRLYDYGKNIDASLLEIKRMIQGQSLLIDQLRRNYAQANDNAGVGASHLSQSKSQSPLLNIAAAAIALGTMAWVYAKLIT